MKKRSLLIFILGFAGILASGNLSAQDDVVSTVKNVEGVSYYPDPEYSMVWRQQGDVSNTLYAYDHIYKKMRQISGTEQVFPAETKVRVLQGREPITTGTLLPGLYIYVLAKFADGTIAFTIDTPDFSHLSLSVHLYRTLYDNADWWEPVTEALAAGELEVGSDGEITRINETAGLIKTRPDIAGKLILPGTSMSNIKALEEIDANFAKYFSKDISYINYDKNNEHLAPELLRRGFEAHDAGTIVTYLGGTINAADNSYDSYLNNKKNRQQRVVEAVKAFLGNIEDVVKECPTFDSLRNNPTLADIRDGKIISKQKLHELSQEVIKLRDGLRVKSDQDFKKWLSSNSSNNTTNESNPTGPIIMPIIVNGENADEKKYTDGETVLGSDDAVYIYEAKTKLFIKKGQPSKRYDRNLESNAFYEETGYQPNEEIDDPQGLYDKDMFLGKGAKGTYPIKKFETMIKAGVLKGKKILIVEDYVSVAEYWAASLMVHGMAKVEVAQNTAEAKEKIKATKFDLIYTDLNMGGYESGLINIIREKDKNVPVIAVTGNSYSSSNYMWNKGYSGYLLKTATDDRLIGGFIYTAIVYLDAKNRYYQVPETTGTIIMPIIVGNDDPNTNKKYVDGETVYGNDGFVYTYELKSQLFIRKGQPSKRYDRALSGANAGAFYEFPGYQPKDDMDDPQGFYNKDIFLATKAEPGIIMGAKIEEFESLLKAGALQGKKILIVDDYLLTAKDRAYFFDKRGADAIAAKSIDEAKKEIEKEKFDLIYLDLNMGDDSKDSRTEIIKFIRSKDTNVPVIAVTGDFYTNNSYLWNMGFSGYLGKPLDPTNMLYSAIIYLDAKNRYYQTPETTGTIIMPVIVNNENKTENTEEKALTETSYLDQSKDNIIKASNITFDLFVTMALTEPYLDKARDYLTKANSDLSELPDKDGTLASKLNFAEKMLQKRPTNALLDRIKATYPQYESYNNDEEVIVSMLNMLANSLQGELKTLPLTQIALGTPENNFEDNIFTAYIDVIGQSFLITTTDRLLDKIRIMILCNNDVVKLANGETIDIVNFFSENTTLSFTRFFLGEPGTDLFPVTDVLFKDANIEGIISEQEMKKGLERLNSIEDVLKK